MVGAFGSGGGGSCTGSGGGGITTGLFQDVGSPVDELFGNPLYQSNVFLSSVRERESIGRKT